MKSRPWCHYVGACPACKARSPLAPRFDDLPCDRCGSTSDEVLAVGRVCVEQCDRCKEIESLRVDTGGSAWHPAVMSKPTDQDLDNRFRYHRPTPEKVAVHEWVTETTLALAKEMRDRLPAGRNLSLVLTLLEDVRMRANAAVACGE